MTSIGDPHLAAAAADAVHPDGTVGGVGFGGAGHTVVVGSGGVALPAGTVTFLLTDVEGSTVLWETRRAEMGAAIARHYDILDEVIGVCGGVRPVEQGEGDSVVAAFAAASDALAAALQAQRRLQTELGWIPVRMAVHSGEAQLRGEGNYVGRAIIRCARLRACGHGGQVLVSAATAALIAEDLPAGAGLADLGTVRLRGLSRPERVWQLTHPDLAGDFAPLRSLQATPHNVPVATSSFIGRDAELGALGELLRHERLVTLTGSGGSAKPDWRCGCPANCWARSWAGCGGRVGPRHQRRTGCGPGRHGRRPGPVCLG